MSEKVAFRLGDLLGLTPACGFLDDQETLDWAEGRLDHRRHQDWERHVLDCPACTELAADLDELQTLAREGLTVAGEARAFAERDPKVRAKLRLGKRKPWQRFSMWLAPAIVVGMLAVVVLWPRPFLIADIETPAFVPPPSVRGASIAQQWDAAEAAWQASDFVAAETVLSAAVAEHPDNADFAFYLGLARMRLDEWDGAAAALRSADRLQADARSETTLWSLATALDRGRRRDEACGVLEDLAGLGGGRAAEASTIVESSCR